MTGDAVTVQEAEPPPTSGNATTIFLGLTAFSLVAVVVGAWIYRSVRTLVGALRQRPSGAMGSTGGTGWHDAAGGSR